MAGLDRLKQLANLVSGEDIQQFRDNMEIIRKRLESIDTRLDRISQQLDTLIKIEKEKK